MPWTFGTAITQATFAADSSGILNGLIAALNQRLAIATSVQNTAINPVQPVTFTHFFPALPNPPAAGDSLQLPWAASLQSVINAIPSDFLDTRIVWDGATTNYGFQGGASGGVWTMFDLRAAASLPPTYIPDGLGGIVLSTVTDTTAQWRRRRPREISTTHDLYDQQGNLIVVGMRAYLVDGHDNDPYVCTVLGTWVLDLNPQTGPVDLLDNTNAATGFCIDPGTGSNGDYVTWEAFEEIRQIINLLRWVWLSVFTANPIKLTATGNVATLSTPNVGWSATLAALAAAWGTRAVAAGLPPQSALYGGSAPGDIVFAIKSDMALTAGTLTTTYSHTVEFYVYADVFLYLGFGAFDAQGDGVTNGAYKKYDSHAITAAASVTANQFGDSTAFPPDLAPDPSPDPAGALGYQTDDYFAIAKYDVAGGVDVF